jgi:hypothetical protein
MVRRVNRSGNPAKAAWDPIRIGEVNPQTPMAVAFAESGGLQHHYRYRTPRPAVSVKAFYNRLYNGVILEFEDGSMHLSFKRNDRAAVRDWRHVQAIKNSVAGPEREAIEIYPPESDLVDASNEYHLWVLPPDRVSPLGLAGQGLADEHDGMDHAAYRQGGSPGARQRGWEQGIPTGLGKEIDDD